MADSKQPPPVIASSPPTYDITKEAIWSKNEAEAESGSIDALPSSVVGELDPHKERKLLIKLDLFFVPVIMLVYLTCYLDRSNIGNVKVAGMPEDIGASSTQFSTAVSIFYATYVSFETPAALLMKKIGPRNLLTVLSTVWSLTTIFTGFIENVGGLYATRLILGACEAGLFPSLNLYLTMVYKREEQAKRVSYLFSCTALSGAFGGLLAYGLLQMDGVGGKAGWRWVYIIEGILSVVAGLAVWFGLPNDPLKAYFLNEEEKEMMQIRYAQGKSGAVQFCQDIVLYGFSTFLPSILKSMDYDTLESNALTIPVYIFGALVFWCTAFASDRFSIRGPFVFFANFFGIAGYGLLIGNTSEAVKYFATFLIAITCYIGPGLNLTWLNVNVAPHYRRAAAIGFQQTIGNCAGIVAGQIYRESPYKLGNGFSLGAVCVSNFFIVGHAVYLIRWNRFKAMIASGEAEDTRLNKTGDRELDFKYNI